MTDQPTRHPASFRDPCGFIFIREGTLYRQVNRCGLEDYRQLMDSGLYQALTEARLLLPHAEVAAALAETDDAAVVLQPERVPTISYPYEWCFDQLRDAALTTLAIQKTALQHGMTLKDASAFNIQFAQGRPVLIDTLSFTRLRAGDPWVAYQQFCRHFLAPLAVMCYTDTALAQLSRFYIDGMPLELASRLLPFRSRFNIELYLHLHLHARFTQKHAATSLREHRIQTHQVPLMQLADHLDTAVRGLHWKPGDTEWGDYYSDTNYSPEAFRGKERLVSEALATLQPATAWDLGANDGHFSRLASERGIDTVAWDIDPVAVAHNYRTVRERGETQLLPLLQDLSNPSPALGWANAERLSLLERGPTDVVLALALVHHLAIGNNLPFARIAAFLRAAGRALIIEFVPKHDSKVQRLLASREDIFPDYTPEAFEAAFLKHFTLIDRTAIPSTERVLYVMIGR